MEGVQCYFSSLLLLFLFLFQLLISFLFLFSYHVVRLYFSSSREGEAFKNTDLIFQTISVHAKMHDSCV